METILNFDLSVFTFMDKIIAACPVLNFLAPYLTWPGDGYFWIALGVIFLIPKKTRKIGMAMLLAQLLRFPVNDGLKALFARPRPFALFNPAVAEKCVYGYTNTKGEWVEGFMSEKYITQVVDNMKLYSQDFIDKWLSTYKYPYEIGYHYSHGYSFPSGHTSTSFCAAFSMLLMCKGKKQKIAGWAAMVLAVIVGFTRIYLHVHYCTDVLGGIAVGLVMGLAGWALAEVLYKHVVSKLEVKISEKIKAKKNSSGAEA